MSYREQALQWSCEGDSLVGIASLPERPVSDVGVLIIVGGPQYRAGSHRQFTLLARRLADAGYPTLRFDVRGMGDSAGETRTFEGIDSDIRSAVDTLSTTAGSVRRVVLWGLCDAASAALLLMRRAPDPRVAGLCLLNPWVRSDVTLARTHVQHYYWQRLRDPAFWRKLVRGGVALKALTELGHNLKLARKPATPAVSGSAPNFQMAMSESSLAFQGPQLLLLSGQDYTAKEFLAHAQDSSSWVRAMAASQFTRKDLPNADHTFSNSEDRVHVEELVLAWLGGIAADLAQA